VPKYQLILIELHRLKLCSRVITKR